MKRNMFLTMILVLFIILGCNEKIKFKTIILNSVDTLENGMIRVSKEVLIYNLDNKKLITKKYSSNNPDNDPFIFLKTRLTDKDSISLHTIDSLFYNKNGFDSITNTYKLNSKKWKKEYALSTKYNKFDSITKLLSTFFDQDAKIEVFTKYDENKNKLSVTRYECNMSTKGCDSIYKELYFYDKNGKFKYSVRKFWKDHEWHDDEECFK